MILVHVLKVKFSLSLIKNYAIKTLVVEVLLHAKYRTIIFHCGDSALGPVAVLNELPRLFISYVIVRP
jgi:hypothetical protein